MAREGLGSRKANGLGLLESGSSILLPSGQARPDLAGSWLCSWGTAMELSGPAADPLLLIPPGRSHVFLQQTSIATASSTSSFMTLEMGIGPQVQMCGSFWAMVTGHFSTEYSCSQVFSP